ncbi:MAG TPA: YtxH domain-containing protein [Paludibacteraceae bacterium]|nr:YtxH domain-containing protein [Paludibacteraceae bacterium]
MSQNAQELFSKNIGTSRKPFYFGLGGAIAGFLLGFSYFEDFIDDGALQATEILSVVGVLIIGALIGVGIAKWKSISNNIKYGLIGAILGALFGVPASYFMQSGFFRGFVPVVKYITNFSEYIQRPELQSTAIVGIVLGAIIGTVIGVLIARKKTSSASK